MYRAQTQGPSRGQRRGAGSPGFTLVEVMVATVLLSMIILGILAVLIGSYRVAAKARYNDHARYVIKSMADQFLQQPTTDSSGNLYELFVGTSATGNGLSWTNPDGTTVVGASGSTSIPVLLGDNTGAPITAQVSRTVWYLTVTGSTPGADTVTPYTAAAGYVLLGKFTISYQFQGANLSQTIGVVRSVP